MEKTAKNKWQMRGVAAVIFALGFTSGILALNAYRAWSHRGQQRTDRLEQLANRLQLSADQKTKVQQIFGETRNQLRDLRQQSEPRVKEIRQQADQQLQQVRNEMRERRERNEDRR